MEVHSDVPGDGTVEEKEESRNRQVPEQGDWKGTIMAYTLSH